MKWISPLTQCLIDGSKMSCRPCITIQGHMIRIVKKKCGYIIDHRFTCDTASTYGAEVEKLNEADLFQ